MSDVDRRIAIGDVCLDLAQGRPVQVVGGGELTAEAWTEQEGYDLVDNYGNDRLGADPDDIVWDCVYCNSLSSRPSKTYAFPSSRLARVEVEAPAEVDHRIQTAIRVEVLTGLYLAAAARGPRVFETFQAVASDATTHHDRSLARELAEVEYMESEDA